MNDIVLKSNQVSLYDGLEAYLQKINSYPMLTAEEEKALFERLQQTGDKNAAYQLVMSHMRFVVRIARGYLGYGLPLKDLIQEGSIGLMHAVKKFEPSAGVRLATYALHWIKSEIHEFVIKNWKLVKIATTKAQRKLFFNLKKFKKNVNWLSKSEIDMVAEELGVSPSDVSEMESRMVSNDISYDYSETEDENLGMAPKLYLEDKESNFSLKMESNNWQENAHEALNEALQQLDERSRYVIQRRWLDSEKATLNELSKKFNVSAERIRQIEINAISQIKKIMMNGDY